MTQMHWLLRRSSSSIKINLPSLSEMIEEQIKISMAEENISSEEMMNWFSGNLFNLIQLFLGNAFQTEIFDNGVVINWFIFWMFKSIWIESSLRFWFLFGFLSGLFLSRFLSLLALHNYLIIDFHFAKLKSLSANDLKGL